MSLIVTRGFGPSAGLAGRDGPVTQGFGAPSSAPVALVPEVLIREEDWRWIEYARLRSIEGTDPMRLGSTRTVDVVLANLGSPTIPHHDDHASSGGSRNVPITRAGSGNAVSHRTRTLQRKR